MTLAIAIYGAVVSTIGFAIQIRWFIQHVRSRRAMKRIGRLIEEQLADPNYRPTIIP